MKHLFCSLLLSCSMIAMCVEQPECHQDNLDHCDSKIAQEQDAVCNDQGAPVLRSHHELENRFLKLNNETLHEFDGVFGLFDGYTVASIGIVMQNMKARLMGIKKADGSFEGMYTLGGKKYCLWHLEDLEALGELPQAQQAEFIEAVKREFMTFIKPFMSRLNIAKNFVIVLMKESCERRACPNSFMLSWSKVNDNELTLFQAQMKSFKQLNLFLEELYCFLGDLAYSCPKGRAQAQKLKAEGKI